MQRIINSLELPEGVEVNVTVDYAGSRVASFLVEYDKAEELPAPTKKRKSDG